MTTADGRQICKACQVDKVLADFHFRNDNGKYRAVCKACWGARCKKWHQDNPERRKAHRDKWERKNPGHVTKRKADYRERHPIKYRLWNLLNPEKKKQLNKDWKSRNRPRVAAQAAKRRAALAQATPKWADFEAIQDVFIEAEYFQLEVDHTVPLTSKLVCGLHCEDNLQLMTTADNRRKSNKYWPDMP